MLLNLNLQGYGSKLITFKLKNNEFYFCEIELTKEDASVTLKIKSSPDYYEVEETRANLSDLTKDEIEDIVFSDGKISFYHNDYCFFLRCGINVTGTEIWNIIEAIRK